MTVKANETLTTEETETNVKYAYIIAGSLMILIGLLSIMLYVTGSEGLRVLPNEKQIPSEEAETQNNKVLYVTFVALVFMLYWMYCNLELSYSMYLTPFVVDELGWSKTSGASLTSVFFGTFTLGRIVGIFVVKYVSIQVLLLASTLLTVVVLVPIVFFAQLHVSVMWISTALFGLSISTIYASGLTFSDLYVSFSGGIGSIFVAAGSLGALTSPLFVVPLFNVYGLQVFVVLLFITAILQFLVFIGAWFVGSKKGERNLYSRIQTSHEDQPLVQSTDEKARYF